jgi:quinol monooxygenase YgiN
MATNDKCCSIVPYFKIAQGKVDAFKEVCQKLVENSRTEPKCLYYGYCFDGEEAHCREGYEDAEGAMVHLENTASLLKQALQVSELTRLEIHGPKEELMKLRDSVAHLRPQFFTLEYGFRK